MKAPRLVKYLTGAFLAAGPTRVDRAGQRSGVSRRPWRRFLRRGRQRGAALADDRASGRCRTLRRRDQGRGHGVAACGLPRRARFERRQLHDANHDRGGSGQEPQVSRVSFNNSHGFVVKGLSISPSHAPSPQRGNMVQINGSSSNVAVEDMRDLQRRRRCRGGARRSGSTTRAAASKSAGTMSSSGTIPCETCASASACPATTR